LQKDKHNTLLKRVERKTQGTTGHHHYSVPDKIMEEILLDIMQRHMENKDVIGDSQYMASLRAYCA